MTTLPPTARLTVPPELIETDLTSELILLDPTTQEMFSLNDSGRVAWLALRTSDLAGAVDAVVQTFEVTHEQAETDVRVLVTRLLESGLLSRSA